jgi:hypothetical protein
MFQEIGYRYRRELSRTDSVALLDPNAGLVEVATREQYQAQSLTESYAQWKAQVAGGTEPATLFAESSLYNSIVNTSYSYARAYGQ